MTSFRMGEGLRVCGCDCSFLCYRRLFCLAFAIVCRLLLESASLLKGHAAPRGCAPPLVVSHPLACGVRLAHTIECRLAPQVALIDVGGVLSVSKMSVPVPTQPQHVFESDVRFAGYYFATWSAVDLYHLVVAGVLKYDDSCLVHDNQQSLVSAACHIRVPKTVMAHLLPAGPRPKARARLDATLHRRYCTLSLALRRIHSSRRGHSGAVKIGLSSSGLSIAAVFVVAAKPHVRTWKIHSCTPLITIRKQLLRDCRRPPHPNSCPANNVPSIISCLRNI